MRTGSCPPQTTLPQTTGAIVDQRSEIAAVEAELDTIRKWEWKGSSSSENGGGSAVDAEADPDKTLLGSSRASSSIALSASAVDSDKQLGAAVRMLREKERHKKWKFRTRVRPLNGFAEEEGKLCCRCPCRRCTASCRAVSNDGVHGEGMRLHQ